MEWLGGSAARCAVIHAVQLEEEGEEVIIEDICRTGRHEEGGWRMEEFRSIIHAMGFS